MKRYVLFGLSVLVSLSSWSRAGEVDFKGNFLDLLVELDTNHGVTVGLDPFELENPKIAEVKSYRSGSKSATEFIEAEAKKLGLLMKKGTGGAYYATSEESSKRDKRLTMFLNRQYEDLIKTKDEKDPIVQLAKLLHEAREHSRKRVAAVDKVASKVKSSFPALNRELKYLSSAKSKVSDARVDRLYAGVDELENMINEQVNLINSDYARCTESHEGTLLCGALVQEYGSLALATRSMLEFTHYTIEPVSHAIEKMDPYHGCARIINAGKTVSLREPGAFASQFKPEVKQELTQVGTRIKKMGRQVESGLKNRGGQLDDAIKHWKAKEFREAYEKVSVAISDGDFSSKTRALYGLFWTKAQSEFAKEVKSRAGTNMGVITIQPMAGIDEKFLEHFKRAYPTVVRGSIPSPKNPGRRGASYGLTVSQESGQVSTFGIQTRPKEPGNEGGRLISAGDQQIEVNSVGEGFLDEHMVASIRDSMSYVSGQHVATLFDERLVILFDSTVDIAYGGDSAGAALATAALSKATDTLPPPDVCMTGAVRAFGDIRPVGGILDKTAAARKKGFRVMLAPSENKSSFFAMPRSEQVGPCQIVLGKTMNDYLPFGLPELKDVDKTPRKALTTYAFAYHLFLAGKNDDSLALCEKTLEICPNHFSAQSLATLLRIAGATSKAPPDTVTEFLAK